MNDLMRRIIGSIAPRFSPRVDTLRRGTRYRDCRTLNLPPREILAKFSGRHSVALTGH